MSVDALITTFVTLFVVIDPIALAPLFVALTRGMTDAERAADRAAGDPGRLRPARDLRRSPASRCSPAIGIGLPAFRISGGMLLFLMAVDMLFERRSERREKRTAERRRARPVGLPAGHAADRRPRRARHDDPARRRSTPATRSALVEVNLVMVAVLALTYRALPRRRR